MKNLKEKICLGFEKIIDFNSEFYTHVTYVGGCISIALILLLFSSHIQNTVVIPSLLFLIPILLAIPTMFLPIHFIFKILIIVLYIALMPLISLIADSLWVLD